MSSQSAELHAWRFLVAERELALVVLGLGVSNPVWRMALTDRFELQWRLTAGAGDANGVGGEIEEELAGEGVVARMEWLEWGGDGTEVVPAGKTAQSDVDRSVAVLVGRAVLRRHVERRDA